MNTGPLFVSSGDLIADRRYKWALDHAAEGDLTGAGDILVQTVELAPAFAAAWFALGAIRDQIGDRAGAIAAFGAARDHDPDDYHGARLRLARLGAGETTPALTGTYVRRLFDQYAARYDSALIDHLAYRGPAMLRDAIEQEVGPPMRFRSLLDLGCGTGLAGAVFRDHAERLTGVDLSPAMVAQARAKAVYDRLEVDDILAFLQAAEPQCHDLVLAADVLVYVHDLVPVVAAVTRVLKAGGIIAFTVETHSGEGVMLQPTLRYAHGADYVRNSLESAGLSLIRLSPASVRTEKGAPVEGLLALAHLVS